MVRYTKLHKNMSHLTTVRMSLKCQPCLIKALEIFALKPNVEQLNVVVDKHQFITGNSYNDKYAKDLVFQWVEKTQDYEVSADFWHLDRVVRSNFQMELQKEYTRQWAHYQAQQLGFSMHETMGDDGNIKFIFSSPTGQIEASVSELGKLQIGVKGVQGEGCLQFSQALEAAAGTLENRQQAAEYYATQAAYYHNQNQQTIGGW